MLTPTHNVVRDREIGQIFWKRRHFYRAIVRLRKVIECNLRFRARLLRCAIKENADSLEVSLFFVGV